MNRTNWQRDVKLSLDRTIARDGDYVDLKVELNAISDVLRYRDGWTNWNEIWSAIFDEAIAVCNRGRRPEWKTMRDYVWSWGVDRGIVSQARAAVAILRNHKVEVVEALHN